MTVDAGARPPARRSSLVLDPYQQRIHDFVVSRPFSGAWINMGGGKTLSTLRALQTLRPVGHILVIAPVAIARSTWIDEIEKWDFPIRTRSLIVDDNDRKLSKKDRLRRFADVFTDPPTMYFVNQELLTQPSRGPRLITPARALRPADAPALTPEAAAILDFVRARGPIAQPELVREYRGLVAGDPDTAPPAESAVGAWIQELVRAKAVTRQAHPCPACSGKGCAGCRFGLIDQMPIQDDHGRKTVRWPFPTVIIDESQGFKSHTSRRFTALARMRPAITRLIELTGTPAPNGLHDLWSQIYLLDEGEALGRTVTEFRKRWFVPAMVPGTTTPATWIPTENAKAEIYAAVSHLVMSAENTSLTLPPLTIRDVNVTLPPGLLTAYRKFRRDLVLDLVTRYRNEDGTLTQSVESIVADNQAVLASKLMQFASGTIYTADPDDPSTKGRYEIIHEKKLEMAEYLVRNTGGAPALIAYHFRSDLSQLLARFAKSGVDARAFDGTREMVALWNAKRIPVMLIHPASAGHGLNLQFGGSRLIWYTLPFSLEHYLQTNARLYRRGQTQPVDICRLIAKGTQDERMPGVLAGKKRTQDDLLDAVSDETALLAAVQAEIDADLKDLWISERV